jgi:Haem-binding domain
MKFLVPAILVLIVALIAIPLNQPRNPAVVATDTVEAALHPPGKVVRLLRRSCYDCHSDTTRWPWYSAFPGLSWLVSQDVSRARSTMNFSRWATGVGRDPAIGVTFLVAACQDVASGRMPLPRYLKLHPEARPTADEQQALCDWARRESKRLASPLPAD